MYRPAAKGVNRRAHLNGSPGERGGPGAYNSDTVRTWPAAKRVCGAALLAQVVLGCDVAHAQGLPSEPIVLGHGRVVISGDVSITASCAHAEGGAACTGDTGYFNYSDYDESTLRMARVGLSTAVRLGDRLTALADVRMENTHGPRPYGLYLRLRPFSGRDFDIQAGRIPSTFGAFARRAYSTDNLLPGYPLAYQYLLSLRPDALPASGEDLIRMRGRGWLSSFPIGNQTPEAGLPLADAFRWDTGVQAHGTIGWLEAAGSVTTGSLAHPLFQDDNAGKQVAGRVAARPVPGLIAGASVSRAPYVTATAARFAGVRSHEFVQQVFGADLEYSRDHYLVRFEGVLGTFDLPTIEPRLRARGTLVEGRYKITPRMHAAARLDHLGFNTIAGAGRNATWEAPVTRWEVGGGYALQRNMQLRASFQRNTRDGGRVRTLNAVAAQVLYWF
jgi:hypothetical protein